MCSADCFLALIAILFPPLPVWVKRGICSADSIINILLLILGYIPGLLHAWYIIAKFPEPDFNYQALDTEHGRVYVFVQGTHGQVQGQQQQHHHQGQPKPSGQPQPQSNMNYGTTHAGGSSSAPAPRPQNQHDAGEGPSDGPPPPSYAQVVAGDHKVQTQD
ncbi:UPF0057-domain-containing protein [Podospora aff. communis PSN243]|uniref:UPF0057-domain-containing protein n=1 Tax=Podospora aff. communis PSN243 TaxID=3040156 RepID=A0AAV9H2K2_9PEZI|nr:UPF0057-domain-containing protein [Podospora aff. communis PSN243]